MPDSKPIIHPYTTPRYLTVNVFLVETEHGVVVIDGATAVSTSHEIRAIIDDQIKKPLLAVLLTHGHPDHYVGVGEIIGSRDVPVAATQGVLDFAKYQDEEKFETLLRRNYGDDLPKVRVLPNHLVKDGDALTFDGVTFQLRDMGPCESDSDSMWLTSIDGVQHAFVGDIVYNHTQSYLRDGHALYWLETLDRLLVDFNHATVLHTSHGNPSCGIEALYWQKGYIQAFLGLLKSMLAGKDTLNDAEKAQLVEHMKAFTENEKVLPLLKFEMDETIRLLAKAV